MKGGERGRREGGHPWLEAGPQPRFLLLRAGALQSLGLCLLLQMAVSISRGWKVAVVGDEGGEKEE